MLSTLLFLVSFYCCSVYGVVTVSLPAFGVPRTPKPYLYSYTVEKLPGVDFRLPESYAGSIDIPGTAGDSLFFWFFRSETTLPSKDLIVWLQGGPGCNSFIGESIENGPLSFRSSKSPVRNPHSWTQLSNVLYIDQPVGTGFSTGSAQAENNSQVVEHFYQWFIAFRAKFPMIGNMNVHLVGESYAGIYIPYFAQKLMHHPESGVKLASVTIGAPYIGNRATMLDLPVKDFMLENNSTLKTPSTILDVFQEASDECCFSPVILALQSYPPEPGAIPVPGNPENLNYKLRERQEDAGYGDAMDCEALSAPKTSAQVNASIYGGCFGECATWTTFQNLEAASKKCFNPYNIRYTCEDLAVDEAHVAEYFNQPSVRHALHAPDKASEACNETIYNTLMQELVEPPAYSIIPDLIRKGIPVHLYSGSEDLFLNHIGIDMVIQNMTWGGSQGFSSNLSRPFVVDEEVVGVSASERNLSYHLFFNAGHFIGRDQPKAAYAFARDVILGIGKEDDA